MTTTSADTGAETPASAGPAITIPGSRVELAIGGMTCASCATRIERKLNKLDGVTASVNYATEQASVDFPATLTPHELVAVVEAAGYSATVPSAPSATAESETAAPA